MKSLYPIFICLLLATTKFFAQDILLESFGAGLNDPVNIKHAGDDRLFVAEKGGLIKIINTDGSVNATPYLDIDSRVTNVGGESGLLGLAFHPDYATNGFFYVNYINNGGNTVISRFVVDSTNPVDAGFNTSNPNSELILLTINQPFGNHNGGDLAFGPDNYLYIATGDGGAAGDPGDRSQSLNTLLGKLLRIDVDNVANGNNYAIPADNPYLNDGDTTTLPEIWAYGLRNPWKFSFDRQTGEVWIGDVGQNLIEEINMVASTEAGVNYGWRCYEGNSVFDTSNCPTGTTGLTFPVAQYTHNSSGAFKCSITGGYRYRGTLQTALVGIYFFADYCSGEIGKLTQNTSGGWDIEYDNTLTNNWVAFGEDVNGELYVSAQNSSSLFRIVQDPLSVGEFAQGFSFKIYPNPSNSGEISLDFSNTTSRISAINIYSIQGKLIHSVDSIESSSYRFNTSDLSSGFYLVEALNSSGDKSTKKLIIN